MEYKYFNKHDSLFFRFIAILMVVIAHYSNFIYEIYGNKICDVLNKLGRYGVSLFFLVSGYGLVKSIGEEIPDYHFLLRRIKTVYLPFLLMQLAALIYIGIPHNEMQLTDWLHYFIGIDYWYILVILFLYVLFYISMKYFKKNHQLCLFILVTILNIILALAKCEEWWYLTNYVFCMGVFLANHSPLPAKSKNLSLIILFAGSFMLSSILYVKMENVLLHDLFKIMAAICFAGFAWFTYAILPFHINVKPLNEIGKCSLYIYILHVQALTFLKKHELESYTEMFLSLIVVIIISVLLEKIVTLSKKYAKKIYDNYAKRK